MLAQKHLFTTPKLDLDIGVAISASVGYETYGRLNARCDNAILLCPPFGGSSRAARRREPDDEAPGWWEALIGPGKSFDTNQYFIIAVDALCSVGLADPLVQTTGPATTDPATAHPYGLAFPQVTIRDNVRLQQQLLTALGIERLVAAAGPGMGGFMALEWAVTFPQAVDRVIAVASAYRAPHLFALGVCQAGIDAIHADPPGGLVRAAHLMATLSRTDDWFEAKWGRRTAPDSAHPWSDREGQFAFQTHMAELAREQAARMDSLHYIYTARACILHDVTFGNRSLDLVAQKIRASLLFISISSDQLFPANTNLELIDAVRLHGGQAELAIVDSPYGHLAATEECNRLAEPIGRFLLGAVVH